MRGRNTLARKIVVGVNSPRFLKDHPVRKRDPKIREKPYIGKCSGCNKPQTHLYKSCASYRPAIICLACAMPEIDYEH